MSTSESNEATVDEAALEGVDEAAQPLELEVDVQSPSACQRHVTVTIPRSDIERYLEDAVKEMMPAANVPGFRPGRAPRKLVESHFRRELKEKIKGALLMDSMTQVTEDQDFSAISEPDFDFEAVELPDEGPLTFEFDIEVRPQFELPQWKGLQLKRPVREFGAKDIDDHLVKLLERHAVFEPSEEPAVMEDLLVLDLTFRHDGRVVSEWRDRSMRLRPELSFRDAVWADFGQVMAGARPGDTKTAQLFISEQAEDEALRGEQVELTARVLDVKRLVPPTMTRDLLQRLGGFDSEGDVRDAVAEELGRQLEYHQNQQIREQITALLTESAAWDLPPELLKRQAHRELQRSVMELRRSGFSDEQISEYANLLRQNSQAATAKALKEHFILERIAEDEELEAEDADFDRELLMVAAQTGNSPRSVRARYEKQGLMDALRNQIVERKAIDRITEEATFQEVPFEPRQNTTTAVDFAIGQGSGEEAIPEAKYGGDLQELPQTPDRS